MIQKTTEEETTEEEARSTGAAGPLMLADADAAGVRPVEFETLATQMAHAYRRQVEFYKKEFEKDLPEALEMAAGASTDELQAAFIEGLRAQPADQVSWGSLRNLEDAGPGESLRKWEEVKAFAREELTSGQRGAAAVEDLTPSQSGPLGRARYSVLVQEMAKDWQPLTGIEYILVEQMAQAYTMQLHWTAQYAYYCVYRTAKVDTERGTVAPARVTDSQMVADAAGMVDRWNRMFLRCLRQLRDLRRYSPVVINNNINNPGQVNVGSQQVNLAPQGAKEQEAASAPRARAKRRRLTKSRLSPPLDHSKLG